MKKILFTTVTIITILILTITSCSKKNPGNFMRNTVWYNHTLEDDSDHWANMILCFHEDSVFFYLRNDDFTVGEKVGNGVYEIDYEYGNDLPCISFDKYSVDISKVDSLIIPSLLPYGEEFIQKYIKEHGSFHQGRESISNNHFRLRDALDFYRLENITPYEITHNPDKKKLWESYRQNKYLHSDRKL